MHEAGRSEHATIALTDAFRDNFHGDPNVTRRQPGGVRTLSKSAPACSGCQRVAPGGEHPADWQAALILHFRRTASSKTASTRAAWAASSFRISASSGRADRADARALSGFFRFP